MRPTIRLTHSLQAMLLMTRHEAPTHKDEERLVESSFVRTTSPLPFDSFDVRLAEPVIVYPSVRYPQTANSSHICVADAARSYPHLQKTKGQWFVAGAVDCPLEDCGSGYEFVASVSAPRTSTQGLRLVMNLITYINSLGGLRDEHLTQVQQSKHGRLKPGTTKRRDYLLGREIKLSPELRALASADGPARYRFKSRWLVRGHFRHQPIGEGRNERKVIWIQPHWKGPKEGPVLVPRYVAGEEA